MKGSVRIGLTAMAVMVALVVGPLFAGDLTSLMSLSQESLTKNTTVEQLQRAMKNNDRNQTSRDNNSVLASNHTISPSSRQQDENVRLASGASEDDGRGNESKLQVLTNEESISNSVSGQYVTFAGHALTLHSNTAQPYSHTQCLSENFLSTSYQYRSCQFRNLCHNVETKGFELHYSQRHDHVLNQTIKKKDSPYYMSSKTQRMVFSPSSATNLKKGKALWEPEELILTATASAESSYYTLPDDVVWIPMFPFKECKSGGQALWDVLLPIYTLLEIFDLHTSKPVLLVTETRSPKVNCAPVWDEFETMMGFTIHPVQDMVMLEHRVDGSENIVTPVNTSGIQSKLICSRRAVGGLGYLMDHGAPVLAMHMHPKLRKLLPAPHNIRRTQNLKGFRDHLLSNMGAPTDLKPDPSNVITFCATSTASHDPAVIRNTMQAIQSASSKIPVQMQLLDLSNTTNLAQQANLIKTTAVMVVMEDAICNAALFLPKDASLIFYSTRTRTDVDLWSNYAGLRIHFITDDNLGLQANNSTQGALITLIHDELDGLRHSIFANEQDNHEDKEKSPNSLPFANQTTVTFINDRPPPTSRAHCIGDDGRDTAWLFRSCHYENLCFDLETKTHVVFPSERMLQLMNNNNTVSPKKTGSMLLSSIPTQIVISGGQSRNSLMKANHAWHPVVRNPQDVKSYYQLPDDVVWISFHPHPNCNGGHLLWDCIMPVFSILDQFNLTDKKLLLTKIGNEKDCFKEVADILSFATPLQTNSEIDVHGGATARKSNLVCTTNSANGMAWYTDHGLNGHGKLVSDFSTPVNVRRGPELVRFRNFLMRRWKIPTETEPIHRKRVLFSILSSRSIDRRTDFAEQIAAVKERLPDVQVDGVAMWNYSWAEQARIASESVVYVSIVGGGTSSAFFLPKGSSLILFTQNRQMLDWDLWNNYAHLRVHWLSTPHLHNDTDLLVDLIQDELDSLASFR